MGGAQVAEHWGFNWLWWIVCGLSLIAALGFMRLHVYSAKKDSIGNEEELLRAGEKIPAVIEKP